MASGAALGATIAAVLRLPPGLYRAGLTQWFAFGGALLAVAVVYALSRAGGMALTTLLLAGVAVSALASAATSFLMYWHGDKLLIIYGWLLGGFSTSSWRQALQVAPYLLVGAAILLPSARALNAFQIGEEGAATLGIDVERLKLLLFVVATLVTAALVRSGSAADWLRRPGHPPHRPPPRRSRLPPPIADVPLPPGRSS